MPMGTGLNLDLRNIRLPELPGMGVQPGGMGVQPTFRQSSVGVQLPSLQTKALPDTMQSTMPFLPQEQAAPKRLDLKTGKDGKVDWLATLISAGALAAGALTGNTRLAAAGSGFLQGQQQGREQRAAQQEKERERLEAEPLRELQLRNAQNQAELSELELQKEKQGKKEKSQFFQEGNTLLEIKADGTEKRHIINDKNFDRVVLPDGTIVERDSKGKYEEVFYGKKNNKLDLANDLFKGKNYLAAAYLYDSLGEPGLADAARQGAGKLDPSDVQSQYFKINDEVRSLGVVKQGEVLDFNFGNMQAAYNDWKTSRDEGRIDTGLKEISLINTFQRMIDPATVREGDVALQKTAQGLWERVQTALDSAKEGKVLDDKLVNQMREVGRALVIDQRKRAQIQVTEFLDSLEKNPKLGFSEDAIKAAREGIKTLTSPPSFIESMKSIENYGDKIKFPDLEIKKRAVNGDEEAVKEFRRRGL